MAELLRAQPEQIHLLYSTLYFARDAAAGDYCTQHPDSALRDLSTAVSHGPDATQHLLASGQPLYAAQSLLAQGVQALQPYRPQWLPALSTEATGLALLLKFLLFGFAGLMFALAMGAAWRGSLPRDATPVSRHNPAVLARDACISLVVAITLWTLVEPGVLKSRTDHAETAPRIEFAVADTLQSLQSPVKAMQDLNQVTLLVLALFFIVQLVIYCFCLIKLREIAKQSLSANLVAAAGERGPVV